MSFGRSKITPQVVQAVRDAVDVVDIASDLTTLKRQGRKYVGLCPFHKEKTPSFQVDPELGLYHCFGCGAGGDAIKMHMDSSGDDFPAAIEALAHRYAIPLPRDSGDGERRGPDLSSALDAAQEFFRHQLQRSDFARSYLERRRIPMELVKNYGLGYAPDGWEHLLLALRDRVSAENLTAAGLVAYSDRAGKLYDRFRHRLMFPIHNAAGRLVGFGGRTLGDDRAKYINTAETDAFHKSELLYGLNLAKRTIRDSRRAVLVEGYFDVIGAAACGIENAVAGMGTSLTAEQAKLLARYGEEAVLAFDGDEAGTKAARRALPLLLAAGLGVRRAPFPAGHDPDSLRLEAGPEVVAAHIENAADAVWMEVESLAPAGTSLDPQAQGQAAQAVQTLLSGVRNPIVKDAYARRAAEFLGVNGEVLLRRGGVSLFEQTHSRRTEVRTEEEKAVSLLLTPGALIPAPEDLPKPEVFLDSDCRNIFAAFCALYREGDRAPESREIVAHLAEQPATLDRMARLLLEESIPEERDSLRETLEMLRSRWQKRRQAELLREIRQAEQSGDSIRLTQLLEEKKVLSRHVHPNMHGRIY
ncbi:MAG: DNA primase [Acidobacteriota bacterium]